MSLQTDAKAIALAAVAAADPYENTKNALEELGDLPRLHVLALGKAASPMARAAVACYGEKIRSGLLITKYGHAGDFAAPRFRVMEAAHPVSDDNSRLAAEAALDLCRPLTQGDTLLVLLSGGGSALMESARVPDALQRDITKKLLARGADIREMNAVRRGLSHVKGGRLAAAAYPARVVTLALSDVPGSEPADIASGPTVPDTTGPAVLDAVVNRCLFDVPQEILTLLYRRPETKINNGGFFIVGDVRLLAEGAKAAAEKLGYHAEIVTTRLSGEARDAAVRLLDETPLLPGKRAYIHAGETTVTLRGTGRGGRNQEMALAAALRLRGTENTVFLAMGSDGTDGPTDAAGGIADGETAEKMRLSGIDPEKALENNDSYPALASADALLVTGPTGTNVNDLVLILTDQKESL